MPPRIAVIDSGLNPRHPHVTSVMGGISFLSDGSEDDDFSDQLGHGTAVAAAILEKAPSVELFAVKVFHRTLATHIDLLCRAIDWSIAHRMQLINLSLGTANPAHEPALRESLAKVAGAAGKLVAAYEDQGVRWLPGSLPGAIPVALDWTCPRDEFRTETLADGRTLYRASGFARPIPGVPPERNLKGISFAVANVTGLLARDYCL